MPKPMSTQSKYFYFREQGRNWIIRSGFYYVDYYGWCHADGYCAIIEFVPDKRKPWVVTVYKTSVPPRPQPVSENV